MILTREEWRARRLYGQQYGLAGLDPATLRKPPGPRPIGPYSVMRKPKRKPEEFVATFEAFYDPMAPMDAHRFARFRAGGYTRVISANGVLMCRYEPWFNLAYGPRQRKWEE